MLSTGIKELRTESDLQYLRQSLKLYLSDTEAAQHFTSLIDDALSSAATPLNFLVHNVNKKVTYVLLQRLLCCCQ